MEKYAISKMRAILDSSQEVLLYVAILLDKDDIPRNVSFVQKDTDVWVWFEDDHSISRVEGSNAAKLLRDYRDGDFLLLTHRF